MREISILSLGNFFASAHFFIIIYVLAPYLATFMPAGSTGLVVSLGAVVTLAAFPFMPRLVAKYSPQRLALAFACLEAVLLLCLSADPTPLIAILFTALACAVSPLLAYQLDLLLEAMVKSENNTGRIRTAFLTAANIALVFAPLLAGVLLDGSNNYGRVFLAAAASLIPFILLMQVRKLPHGKPPVLRKTGESVLRIFQDKDLRAAAYANVTLQFFYHLAPLYIPLYLHTTLGFPWSTLGWVFAVMLIPFPLLEYPAGCLADTWLGDKELMMLGFIITGISFGAIAFITASTSILIILCILVATRVGAALIEAMVEGHFFRRVSEEDADMVSLFRAMRPVGALTAPLVGSILLSITTYSVFFVVTAVIILIAGTVSTLAIRDIYIRV